MIVVFVHGWSVTDTETYGELPEALAARASMHGISLDIKQIWLSRYISFNDEVTISDIARTFQQALSDKISENGSIQEFSCITHSTGGPVVREWLQRYYGANNLKNSPLRHLVMLAPANHGSALAALGKARVGRIKAWFNGIEPGQHVLDWLCLGSQQQIDLARSYINYKPSKSLFFPFVLTGQTIDNNFYDFLNSYLVEKGSDGVVRVAGANLNYSLMKLVETDQEYQVKHGSESIKVHLLEVEGKLARPEKVPLGIIPDASHSGEKIGIMRSVLRSTMDKKTQVDEILKCLKITTAKEYIKRGNELDDLTKESQKDSHRYSMLVFVIKDDQGEPVLDYDLFLLGSKSRDPDKLSQGFFVDRQQNSINRNHLVYYIDYDEITKNKLTGFRVIARPTEGFVFYHAVEYRPDDEAVNTCLKPNETFYIEIVLHRCVDENVYRFDNASSPQLTKSGIIIKTGTRHDFKEETPSHKLITP